MTGSTLEAGTWQVSGTPTVQSTLTFASPAVLSAIGVGASVSLNRPNTAFTNLSGITTNAGSLSLAGGQGFTTAGAFTNSGTITLGPGDVLGVTGAFTQTSTGALDLTIAGTVASGKFGAVHATGAASPGGTLAITVPSAFTPTTGDSYPILTYSSHTGTFATITGLSLPAGLSMTPAYNAKNFTLTVAVTKSAAAPATSFAVGPEAVAATSQPGAVAPLPDVTTPAKSAAASSKTGSRDQAQRRQSPGPRAALPSSVASGGPLPPHPEKTTTRSD